MVYGQTQTYIPLHSHTRAVILSYKPIIFLVLSVGQCNSNIQCDNSWPGPVKPTNQTLDEKVEHLKETLTVPPEETSAFKRKLVCMEDDRPSSQTVGVAGLVLIIAVFGGLIALDLPRLFGDILESATLIREQCSRDKLEDVAIAD
jgi:hypothetical protein